MQIKYFLFIVLVAVGFSVQAADPVVSNVRASQRPGTQLVDITYDLADPDSASLTVSVAVSDDGGSTYAVPVTTFSGALGAGITPGNGKKITWDAGTDWPGKFSSNMRFRITADDQVVPSAPTGMALIPAGSFIMGNCMSSSEGLSDELPTHTVYVSAFYMDKYEVTKALWDSVYVWAVAHGYSFSNVGSGKASNHPVYNINANWYDMVKWCNARSEKEGKVPAYCTNASLTTVYRTGQVILQNDWVKWNAGYRLPTEAEWEKAARGGLTGKRFPWGDTITHSQANYCSKSSYAYDISLTRGYHQSYDNGPMPYTSPVGSFAPNGYGLYDMAGNGWEWCWDWYGPYSSGSQADPHGPTSGTGRVDRGGGWGSDAVNCRVADRYESWYDRENKFYIGFRSVLTPTDIPIITVHPTRQRIRVGETGTLSVTATGSMPLCFQWQKDGINIPGATKSSLVLTNIQFSDRGTYSVTVSNSAGSALSLGALIDVYSVGGGET